MWPSTSREEITLLTKFKLHANKQLSCWSGRWWGLQCGDQCWPYQSWYNINDRCGNLWSYWWSYWWSYLWSYLWIMRWWSAVWNDCLKLELSAAVFDEQSVGCSISCSVDYSITLLCNTVSSTQLMNCLRRGCPIDSRFSLQIVD